MDIKCLLKTPGQANVEARVRRFLCGAVRTTLAVLLEEELRTLVGASRQQRNPDRLDYRNGGKLRRVRTTLGPIEVKVPRTRLHGACRRVLRWYDANAKRIDSAIALRCILGDDGSSLAKTVKVLEGHLDPDAAFSEVNARLDEFATTIRTRPVSARIPVLELSTMNLSIETEVGAPRTPILIACESDQRCETSLLAITVGDPAFQDDWRELVGQLIDRGLRAAGTIVPDDGFVSKEVARELLQRTRTRASRLPPVAKPEKKQSPAAPYASGAYGRPRSPGRRRFSPTEKLRIIDEYEALGRGKRGALLRREGISSSHISQWRQKISELRVETEYHMLAAPELRGQHEHLIETLIDEKTRMEERLAELNERITEHQSVLRNPPVRRTRVNGE